ncbi:putative polysaccharide biosynthesis protein [Enterococcus faecalis]
MAQKEMRTMMQGAFVLTVASFIAKVLSAFYRIPFQNFVGDEGFYVYQQVYPIYGIAMTLALSGLPQFISKIVAEQTEVQAQKRVLQQLFPYVLLTGVAAWGLIFVGSGDFAKMMGDPQLKPLIQVVSFTFLLVPILSFYRGNFQGHLLMTPSAISQVLEQLVRVAVILAAALAFKNWGWSVYKTGTVAMSGALLGGSSALLILWYYHRKIQSGSTTYLRQWHFSRDAGHLFKRLLLEGGLVSLYSAFLILFQLVDSFVVKNSLIRFGLNDLAAKIDKGIYDRGQPLVQLGLVVALALSSTFLPGLTKYFMKDDQQQFLQVAKVFLRLTTTIAAAATVGLILLLPYMNFTLFKDYKGNGVLGVYVFSILLMAVIQAYQSIAQSQNHFLKPLLAAVLGLIVKAITTSFFTVSWGTFGASLSTIAGLLITLTVLCYYTQSAINQFLFERNFLKKLLASLGVMVLTLLVFQGLAQLLIIGNHQRSHALLVTLLGVVVGGSVFIYMIIKLKLFTTREWLTLPFGAKILRMKR